MTAVTDQTITETSGLSTADPAENGGANALTVNRVVAGSVLLGSAAVTLALIFGDTSTGPFHLTWIGDQWLQLALLAMTCLCVAEAVSVRLSHDDEGETVEELNLLEGVVLLSALMLPIHQALFVTLLGSLVPYALRRLNALKILYNLGVYASAASAATLLVQVIMPGDGRLDARLVLAMVVATTAFVLVNLVHMVLLLSAMGGARPTEVLREDARLSLLTIVGTVGVTGTVLVMVVAAPLLLPCAVLPAIALRFAYAASAAKQAERRRSARVLAFSQVLASGPSRDEAIESFLHMIRLEFDASAAVLDLDGGGALIVDAPSSEVRPYADPAALRPLTEHRELRVVEAPDGMRPWSRVMSAPVLLEGEHIGTALVARQGRARFQTRELSAFRSLVASLVVALQNAENMRLLVEETSKLRAVVDQAGDGIVVLGRDHRVQIWSPAMTRITGVPAEVAIGARLVDTVQTVPSSTLDSDPFAQAEQQLTPATPNRTTDIEVVRTDGERRATRFSHAAAFADGILVRDVVIVRDLTSERQAERMKSDFIATVSHELRTPLTPIKGYATMLLKRGDVMPPEKRQRALDIIVDRAEHLGRLVEDLLAASTITAGHEPKHALATGHADLEALVSRACEDFPAAAAGRFEIQSASGAVSVIGDPTRVVQIISNLLSNALKYSPADAPVRVSVAEVRGEGHVTVTDTGAGIPVDQRERIFDKFHRVEDPMVMSTGGTGLGLFIARRLAQAMGGEIAVESTLGVGSTFTLSVPLQRAED